MSPADFWELTPREFRLYAEGYFDEYEFRQNEAISIAYMTALWTCQWTSTTQFKHAPDSLEKILGASTKQKEMTDDEMLNQVKALNAMMGGEVS